MSGRLLVKVIFTTIGLVGLLALFGGCAAEWTSQAAAAPVVTVEVTRVVLRELVVPATPTPPTACSPEQLAEAEEVVIGALLPLSNSPQWPSAQGMQTGLNAAAEMLASGVGGLPVRVITYDPGDDPARAAQMAEMLITEDCALGLIVGLNEEASGAVRLVSERFRKPMLVIAADAPSLTEGQPSTVFRLAPSAPMVARMPATWLAEVGDYNNDGNLLAVLVAENSPAGDRAVAEAEEWFAQYEIELAVQRVDLPAADFSPQIARLLSMDTVPDAVFVSIAGDAGLDFQQQMLEAGIRPEKGTLAVLRNQRALDGPAFWSRVPSGAGTIVERKGPWPATQNAGTEAFANRYARVNARWPEFSSFLAHDAVLLLIDAIGRAPSLRGMDLVKALEASDVELAAGRYSFPYGSAQPPDGQATPEHYWHQWTNPPLLYLRYTQELQDPAQLDVVWPDVYRTTAGPVERLP